MPAPPVFTPPPGNPRFPLFDSLRGIAVLCVFTTHATIAAGANLTGYGEYTMRLELALTIFFIVSGFLLYRPYVSARINGTPAPRLADYARNRFLRIVPAYWVAMTVLAIYPGLGGFWTDHTWVYYVFAQELDLGWSRGGILPTWSITVEVVFYAMLPALAYVMTRSSFGQADAPRAHPRRAGPGGGPVPVGIAYRVLLRGQIGDDPTSNLWALIPGSIDWLAIGMGLALASAALRGRERQPAPVRLVERAPGLCWALMLVLFWVSATQLGRTGAFPETTTPQSWLGTHMIYGVIAGLLVLPAVFGDDKGGFPRRRAAQPGARLVRPGLVRHLPLAPPDHARAGGGRRVRRQPDAVGVGPRARALHSVRGGELLLHRAPAAAAQAKPARPQPGPGPTRPRPGAGVNARAGRFPLLDSLRAIAMIIVVMAHVAAPAGAREGAALSPYLNRLAVGLTMFFLISAFLLYRPFVRARVDGKRRPNVAAYGWGRFLRIVPGYWMALIVTSLWLGTAGVLTLTGAPQYFGFAQIYSNETALGGIAVAWSLCVEVTFYVFLPIFAAAMWRLPGRTRSSRIAGEFWVIGGLILFSVGYKVLVSQTGLHEHSAALLALPAYLDWLAAGMGLAVLSVWLEGRDRSPAPLRVVDRWPVLPWLGALVAFWVVSTQIGLEGGFPRPDEIGYLAEHMLYLLVGFLLFLPAVFGDPSRGVVRKILANPVLAYLGLISYGIFLYHLAVIEQLKDWNLGSIGFIHPYILWPVATLVIASAIATVSWYGLERPALSLKRLVGGKREPQPLEATAEPSPGKPMAVVDPH